MYFCSFFVENIRNSYENLSLLLELAFRANKIEPQGKNVFHKKDVHDAKAKTGARKHFFSLIISHLRFHGDWGRVGWY